MTKIKKGFFSSYNTLISIVMSILGFSSACNPNVHDEYGVPVAEYGVPMATFVVKGNITSESNKTSISHIQVTLDHDTSYTDTDGNYSVQVESFPEDQSFTLEIKDIDSTENGLFEDQNIVVDFINPEFSGESDSWYEGTTEKKVDITLKPQK